MAPEQGSPYRPLYDDKIVFSGQPIALVVAEDWENARSSRLRGPQSSTQEEAHVTDLYAQRDKAFVVEQMAARSRAAMPTRPSPQPAYATKANIIIPIEHHNPMELYASTAIWDGDGKLTVYDKTQGVQNVQQYLCGVFGMQADKVRVLSPYMGGGVRFRLAPAIPGRSGGAGGARAEALGARRADPPADVRARLSAGDDPAARAGRQGRRYARGDHA